MPVMEISGGTADAAMMRQAHPNHMGRVHYGPPVSKLPDEVLREIFVWLKIMFPCSPSGCFAWSPILRVNRRWKEVATGCSFLWSELDITFNIPRTYFTYSNVRPLILWWSQAAAAALGVTLDQRSIYFPRARRLFLLGLPQDNGAHALQHLTSFPLLEELELYPDSDEPLAEVFISGHYPKLTRLIVSLERHFQWHYKIFSSNLQYLELRNCGFSENVALKVFIDGLRNMPFLETLRLLNVDVDIEEEVLAVALPKLRSLILRGLTEVCTALLECFTLPLNTNIDIHCLLPLGENNDVQNPDDEFLQLSDALLDLSEALRDKIAVRDDSGSLLSPPIKYMMAQQYQYDVEGLAHPLGAARLRFLWNDKPHGESLQKNLVAFDAVSREIHEIHDTSGYQPDLAGIQVILMWDVKVTKPETSRPLPSWPRVICQSLPLEQVTTVSVDLDWWTTAMGIGSICPNVTTVIAKNVQGEIHGLRYLLDTDDNGKHRAHRPHFPKLKTLVIDRLDVPCPSSLRQELDRLRLSLRGLRISRTLTLEQFYFARQDPVASRIVENYLLKFRELKAAFPNIHISLLDENFLQWA